MQERRKHTRYKVTQALAATDLDRERILGHLVDVSLDGLMLITRETLPVNRVFQLQLELPTEMAPARSVVFGAESLWQEPSGDSGHYWVGMHIIDISPENSVLLSRLIDDYR
ncbi:PilZ domain-containing protein [Methylococcus sp. EFPC2]|uniref:PilZ domain-containing protein n=1 Tax=Methylococcus sp. EFPC2 TaxID=2812648 RepID=UPI001966D0F0|nr:PilZ domain-containing protein [Methylococcus sp. EFPC2]QSA96053.1 PilZ domain-containing protein [Methylococcus sp. EFPC2]